MTRCASCGARNPSVGVATHRDSEGIDEIGRDDDDQFGLVALKPLRAEQLAEDRDIAEPRHLGDVLLDVSCSRPPSTKLWPLPSSTVVSARRIVSAGIVKTAQWSMRAGVLSSLTSERILRTQMLGDR